MTNENWLESDPEVEEVLPNAKCEKCGSHQYVNTHGGKGGPWVFLCHECHVKVHPAFPYNSGGTGHRQDD